MKNFALISALALILSAPAQAETTNCTAITALPYTISTQGVYCLTGHLSTGITAGNAITINANNVVLDLNGFKLGGQAAGLGTTASGIYAFQRQNITIKNGTVRGFMYGVFLNDYTPYTTSQGHVVEDIRADQNTLKGMDISGNGNVIRNNQVVATGGTTTSGVNASAYGIGVFGPGAQVLNNMVTEVAAQGAGIAYGFHLDTTPNSVVAQNRVGGVTSPSGTRFGLYVSGSNNLIVRDNSVSSTQYGFFLSSSSDLIVRDNSISGAQYGIFFDVGTGKYFNNVTQGVTTPYTGGTAAGSTNY